MASALADGKLRLPISTVRGSVSGSVPKLVMASALADGKLQLPTSKMRGSVSGSVPKLVMASALADGKLQLSTSKVCGSVSGSVVEAGDGVRATNAKLPSPSRRFMTPEVAGRRCCY
ncbi:hypothetical protein PF005_g31711 [Phytophthora fragariae]|uniref:Uncharacterized protein n=1 Tax=Phytophthora fragariae TaxID=53985 RepID=A0A6A3V3S6_9STRA|nr:hypothetical protein PF005_g31711 [Phytophthora fragariae]